MQRVIRLTSVLAVVCVFIGFSPSLRRLRAEPIEWTVAEGGNGHYYEFVVRQGSSWTASKRNAEQMSHDGVQGHLATITSQEENDFLWSLHPRQYHGGSWSWLGGFQDSNAPDYGEPSRGWQWVTDEPWGFTNWHPGEPNNEPFPVPTRTEDYLTLYSQGMWNDLQVSVSDTTGYFVEYELIIGDFNRNGRLDSEDIDLLSAAARQETDDAQYDLNDNTIVDQVDRVRWIHDLKNTWFGDADLNGQFDATDIIIVLASAEYEDDIVGNSGWASGDWNGDGDFTTKDIVVALADGGYEQGARAALSTVPEPSSLLALMVFLVCIAMIGLRANPWFQQSRGKRI